MNPQKKITWHAISPKNALRLHLYEILEDVKLLIGT